MSVNDPIADLLTRIRNAGMARHQTVTIPLSKIKRGIAEILQAEGYIKSFEVQEGTPFSNLVLTLKYAADRKPVITGLKRVSRPGLRVYTKRNEIPRVRNGLGLSILSTPKGLMTGDAAWKAGVGGEIVCYIW
ncbi:MULTISPECIES: 30S ribosomal protein S8 [Herpetosiphon]|uniref:Small ribosomal subunit protein uS8 n=2 Tax=Herpetosiphon TaxID=64 RepID=A0A0P6Y751_9CHLR|nr:MULTISPECIES: 30S ribosomal protein S8 [Herpetosiphon]ABX07558.1 ribosomal protein S8 [Herpetosiphon aurantiacus DSM 785]MBM7841460.1 small subunit ribosomal protein S8 [Herpetosiphon giganteus]MCA0353142.1 30S ribosomal protein S8 [Chloroflexota bacterium]KPL85541.1 30S ribosomal protein S8 [Herpetosiphon geysericola]HBW49667.1 30S ribosomal protein S8 [Herpetosiphon sp.]